MSTPATATPAMSHDCMFKWVISEFLEEFFELFFPNVKVQNCELMDKEFYQKVDIQTQSVEADLLILAQVLIEDKLWQLVILIELKSRKAMAMDQIRRYLLRACLITDLPVWPLLLFTDDSAWQSPVEDRFPLAFHSVEGFTEIPCDIIRLKACKSEDLIARHSLLAKLFALKAEGGADHTIDLVRDIYQFMQAHDKTLEDSQKLVAEKFVATYAKLEPQQLETLKQEVDMEWMGNTISEHYILIGEKRGILKGELQSLERLLHDGMINQAYFDSASVKLKAELATLEQAPKRATAAKRAST